MATVTFDTHKFVQRLRDAGIPEAQAEAISEAFHEAQGEAEFATKQDIAELRHEIELLRRDIDARLALLEQRLTIKLGTLIAVAIGLVATLVKLL
jgi:hypothetical protein